MVDIIFKNAGPWGAGKGSRLVSTEVDDNFWSLKQAVEALQSDPLQPLQIEDIIVAGNQLTVIMSDLSTTFGPFTLPAAAFNWTDAWLPDHNYKAFDLFTANEGMFLVRQDHTSDFTFDPLATNTNGRLYALIFPYPNLYEFGFFFPGLVGASIDVDRPIGGHIFRRQVILPADFAGSGARLWDAPIADLSFSILQNDVNVGSLDFLAYELFGTFSSAGTALQFEPDDVIYLLRPTLLDVVARELTVTFKGELGSLS